MPYPGVAAMAGYSMGLAAGTNIPIEHLDYKYISKCNKASEVEKILRVLRRVKLSLVEPDRLAARD